MTLIETGAYMNDGATEDRERAKIGRMTAIVGKTLATARGSSFAVTRSLLRPLKSALFDGCENFAVDVTTLAELGRGQTSKAHRVLAEIVFPLIEHASLMEKSDRVGVQALVWVFPNSFDGGEDQVGS